MLIESTRDMLDELKRFALPCYTAEVYNDKIEKLGCFDMIGLDKLYETGETSRTEKERRIQRKRKNTGRLKN